MLNIRNQLAFRIKNQEFRFFEEIGNIRQITGKMSQ